MKNSIEVKMIKFWIQTDSSGEYLEYPSFTIEVKNNSQLDWDGVVMDYCLVGANGKIINLQEFQMISSGLQAKSTQEINVCIYESGINPLDISGSNHDAYLVLRVSGYSSEALNLGEIEIPSAAGDISLVHEASNKNSLHIISGTVSRGQPDDSDVEINANLAIQNVSNRIFSRVQLKGEVIDKTGKIIDDNFGASTGVSASSIIQSRGFSYIKEKKLKGAKLRLSLEADTIHEGFVLERYSGIHVLGAEHSNVDGKAWEIPNNQG